MLSGLLCGYLIFIAVIAKNPRLQTIFISEKSKNNLRMKTFLKIILGSLIGAILAMVIVIFFLAKGLGTYFDDLGKSQKKEVKELAVLKLEFNYDMSDRSNEMPEFVVSKFDFKDEIGLNQALEYIKAARDDDRIRGIYLRMDAFAPGMATIETLRNAIIDFRESGKKVIAYGEMVGQKQYYLATAADEIYINPNGVFVFKGFSSQIVFLKNALDRLGIEMQIFRVGKFKSAIEPFTREEMSEENRQQVRSYLNSVYHHFLSNIGGERDLAPEFLDSVANNLLAINPVEAERQGLIDGTIYEDELLQMFDDEFLEKDGDDENGDDREIQYIKLKDYIKALNGEDRDEDADDAEAGQIAVVFAEGDIVDGNDKKNAIGSYAYAETLRKLRKDDDIKAVVLRVNSPGGSALASDVIWREMTLLKEAKPVVVSMGNLAASGGYYIACPADHIFAEPNTLTGSIGVFGILPNFKNLFNEELGITFDTVKTAEYADMPNLFRPVSTREREIIQQEVDNIYDQFLLRVGEGRDMDTAQVKGLAQGRVWTGLQAVENGLADQVGGLQEAIDYAAEMAELETYQTTSYPKIQTLWEQIEKMLKGEGMEKNYMKSQLGEYYNYFQYIKSISEQPSVQMRLPYEVVIND